MFIHLGRASEETRQIVHHPMRNDCLIDWWIMSRY